MEYISKWGGFKVENNVETKEVAEKAVKKKKPFYKKWWVWAVAVVVIGVALSQNTDNEPQNATGNVGDSGEAIAAGTTNKQSEPDESISAANEQTSGDKPETASNNEPKAEQKPEKKPNLELIDHKSTSDSFSSYIEGTIKNNSGRDYSYVQVEINLYDKDGAQIGSTIDNVNNLEAGATWKFKAIVLESNVASYKIKDITGF